MPVNHKLDHATVKSLEMLGINIKEDTMNWTILSKDNHFDLALSRQPNYLFAKKEIIVPICSFELQTAVGIFPLIFVRREGQLEFCALLGLERENNLFVDNRGAWAVKLRPALLEAFPFRIGKLKDGKNAVLFSKGSDLFVERNHGIPLFSEDRKESETLKKYIHLLGQIEASNALLQKACGLIEEFGLLETFAIKFDKKHHQPSVLEGLLKINNTAFEELEEQKFRELRASRALELIYAHFYSLPNVEKILRLASLRDNSQNQLKNLGEKIFDDGQKDLEINFD